MRKPNQFIFPSIPSRNNRLFDWFVNRREGKRSPPISGISADCVEIGNHFRGNLEHRRLKILAKMFEGTDFTSEKYFPVSNACQIMLAIPLPLAPYLLDWLSFIQADKGGLYLNFTR
jgi:hypothetical protein